MAAKNPKRIKGGSAMFLLDDYSLSQNCASAVDTHKARDHSITLRRDKITID